ncbi:MAG: TIGR00341 family protein [Flavobacteriales bacterium]
MESESDQNKQDSTRYQQKDELKNLPSTLWKFILSIFSFSNDSNVNPIEVIDNIKKEIEFKGYNVWVLMCSIVIASIGLNVNSIAVVIGAMLISPLMGPIRGIGLSVGTNNFKLLIYSLINFGVATVVSILVSFLYFKIMPFKDATAEILARTEPLILDVLIAFFGGLAGIIAASRNDNSTVVPGVAIATALMPPLCVTGYGLATGNWDYTFGAFYLFLLNSLFICLSTIVVVRYLKFPLATYVNKKKERNIKIYISIILIIILVPSGMKFMEVFNKSVFTNTAGLFVKERVSTIPKIKILDTDFDYDARTVSVVLVGSNTISVSRIEELQGILNSEDYGLDNTSFVVIQNDEIENNTFTMDDYRMLVKDWEQKIIDRDKEIIKLKEDYSKKTDFNYDLTSVNKKLKLINEFKPLESFAASKAYRVDMSGNQDTTLLIVVNWKDSALIETRSKKLKNWIEINFETNNYEIIEKTK